MRPRAEPKDEERGKRQSRRSSASSGGAQGRGTWRRNERRGRGPAEDVILNCEAVTFYSHGRKSMVRPVRFIESRSDGINNREIEATYQQINLWVRFDLARSNGGAVNSVRPRAEPKDEGRGNQTAEP